MGATPSLLRLTASLLIAGGLLAACAGGKVATSKHGRITAPPGRSWRVAVLGDSIEHEVAPKLTADLEAAGVTKVFVRTFSGEAFCSAWANHGKRVADFRPDVVLIEGEGLSFSDCAKQPPYPADPSNGRAWQAALTEQLRGAIYELRQGGPVQVLLDAGPIAKPLRPYQEQTRATYASLAKRYPDFITALDVQRSVLGPKGGYVDVLPCTAVERRSGRCSHAPGARPGMIRVRAYDRRHFCLTPEPAAWPKPGCSTYASGIVRYAAAQAEAVVARLHR